MAIQWGLAPLPEKADLRGQAMIGDALDELAKAQYQREQLASQRALAKAKLAEDARQADQILGLHDRQLAETSRAHDNEQARWQYEQDEKKRGTIQVAAKGLVDSLATGDMPKAQEYAAHLESLGVPRDQIQGLMGQFGGRPAPATQPASAPSTQPSPLGPGDPLSALQPKMRSKPAARALRKIDAIRAVAPGGIDATVQPPPFQPTEPPQVQASATQTQVRGDRVEMGGPAQAGSQSFQAPQQSPEAAALTHPLFGAAPFLRVDPKAMEARKQAVADTFLSQYGQIPGKLSGLEQQAAQMALEFAAADARTTGSLASARETYQKAFDRILTQLHSDQRSENAGRIRLATAPSKEEGKLPAPSVQQEVNKLDKQVDVTRELLAQMRAAADGLKSGNRTLARTAIYAIAKANDPDAIVTKQDFEAAMGDPGYLQRLQAWASQQTDEIDSRTLRVTGEALRAAGAKAERRMAELQRQYGVLGEDPTFAPFKSFIDNKRRQKFGDRAAAPTNPQPTGNGARDALRRAMGR